MTGLLNHTESDVIRYLMVDLSLGTLPSAAGSWPIYVGQEPDLPDNCITVYDTEPVLHGRTQIDGETQQHDGLQVRVRAATFLTGYRKAAAIADAFDSDVRRDTVTIDSDTYLVHAVNRSSGPIPIGRDAPKSTRELFTINFLVSLEKTN